MVLGSSSKCAVLLLNVPKIIIIIYNNNKSNNKNNSVIITQENLKHLPPDELVFVARQLLELRACERAEAVPRTGNTDVTAPASVPQQFRLYEIKGCMTSSFSAFQSQMI